MYSIHLRKGKAPRKHIMFGENGSLGFIEAVHKRK